MPPLPTVGGKKKQGKKVESKRTFRRYFAMVLPRDMIVYKRKETKGAFGNEMHISWHGMSGPSLVDLCFMSQCSSTCTRITPTPLHICTYCFLCLLKSFLSLFTWISPLHPSRHILHGTSSWKASKPSCHSLQSGLTYDN